MSTPKDAPYKVQQREFERRAQPRPLVGSIDISATGLELRRRDERTELVKRKDSRGILDVRGRRPGIGARIDASVRRAVALGLGKLRRLYER